MELSAIEHNVMGRFGEKTHMAGGAKAGYMLRREAIAVGVEGDVDDSITSLVDKGLLAVSEKGEFVYLTEEGAAAIDR